MLITLHKNARTTPAIRAEIAASNESTRALAKFGVSELTIAKWRLPHTPHRLQTTLSPELILGAHPYFRTQCVLEIALQVA